jgi:hypothetical protein
VVRKLLGESQEAAEFIRSFVVQAKLNERGNYGAIAVLLQVPLMSVFLPTHVSMKTPLKRYSTAKEIVR